MDKFKIVFWVIAIGSILLRPYFKRRRQRGEAEKGNPASAAPPASAEEPQDEGGPSLPYEDLVEEVFGPYIARRKEQARPRPSSAALRAGVRNPAARPSAEAEPPEAGDAKPVAGARSQTARAPEPPVGRESAPSEPPVRPRSIDQRLFGRRQLSPAARLIIAAEILRPPRVLRTRGAFWNR
ncbi:MAG TPA: hypothetical protein VMU54_22560 [Planctomycetota bacterium]|nr:hypothetical protein [Planctomycetota bacterium]